MLITKLKTSKDLNPPEPADISTIKNEVKKHGFYSAFCINVVDAPCHDDLMRLIKKMALQAHLKVSFNAAESICVFEANDSA